MVLQWGKHTEWGKVPFVSPTSSPRVSILRKADLCGVHQWAPWIQLPVGFSQWRTSEDIGGWGEYEAFILQHLSLLIPLVGGYPKQTFQFLSRGPSLHHSPLPGSGLCSPVLAPSAQGCWLPLLLTQEDYPVPYAFSTASLFHHHIFGPSLASSVSPLPAFPLLTTIVLSVTMSFCLFLCLWFSVLYPMHEWNHMIFYFFQLTYFI